VAARLARRAHRHATLHGPGCMQSWIADPTAVVDFIRDDQKLAVLRAT
jgi:hypothetical protein